MSCDIAKPCKLPLLNSGEERFLLSHETFGFILHIFIGLMLQVRDMKQLSQAFILKCLYPSFCLSEECPGITPIEEDGDDQGFIDLELGLEADVTLPYPC